MWSNFIKTFVLLFSSKNVTKLLAGILAGIWNSEYPTQISTPKKNAFYERAVLIEVLAIIDTGYIEFWSQGMKIFLNSITQAITWFFYSNIWEIFMSIWKQIKYKKASVVKFYRMIYSCFQLCQICQHFIDFLNFLYPKSMKFVGLKKINRMARRAILF